MNIFVRFLIFAPLLYVIVAESDDSACSSYPIDTAVYLPDPYDCAKYYECYGGKLFVMSCPAGLYWSQKEENCDFKENVNCLEANSTTPAVGPTTTSRGTTQSNNATTEASDPRCSSFPPEELNFLPDPYDCTKYYQCYEGKLAVMNCPTNLYWNEKMKYCDYKENVICSETNATTPAIGPTTTSRGTTQSNNGTTEAADPRCSAFPPEELHFLPDPFDCTKYYQCYEGKLAVMNCPTNLYWNEKMNYCDYKENVICSDNSSTTKGPATTPGTTIPSNATTVEPDPICNGYPAEDVTFLPDSYDCKKYYECFGGKLFVMSCAGDLYWNQEKQVCDYQSDVHCDQDNKTTTTPRGNTNPDNNVTTVKPDPTCSGYPAESVAYLPDPKDCKKYYECFNGKLFVMSCSGDLYWNQDQEVCDYENNVNCSQVLTTLKPITIPTTTTTTVRTTTPVKTTSNPDISATICIGQPDGTFVADPYDCRSYYDCVFQTGTKQTCPSNMYWNGNILNCDYENNVDCTQSKFHNI